MNIKQAIINTSNVPTKFDKSGGQVSGNTTITGTLTVSNDIFAQTSLKVGTTSKTLKAGIGSSDVYIHNSTSNKYLQLKDDGTLSYSDSKVWHEGNFNPSSKADASHDHTRLQEKAGGGHYLFADRYSNWKTKLYMAYGDGASLQDSVEVNYANSAGYATSAGSANDADYAVRAGNANYASSADNATNSTKINGKKITVGGSQPSGPATGDIWITW